LRGLGSCRSRDARRQARCWARASSAMLGAYARTRGGVGGGGGWGDGREERPWPLRRLPVGGAAARRCVRRIGRVSEGDVVFGIFVLGVREAVAVEGEVVVETKELLGGVEVHEKQHGGRLAVGLRRAAGEVGMEDVEGGGHGVDAGGEHGEGG